MISGSSKMPPSHRIFTLFTFTGRKWEPYKYIIIIWSKRHPRHRAMLLRTMPEYYI